MMERRVDNRGLNLMQRVFDALGSATSMLTMGEIAARLGVDDAMVANALQRLRKYRCVRSICIDNEWRYGLRPGSERPSDRRGSRQLSQEIVA